MLVEIRTYWVKLNQAESSWVQLSPAESSWVKLSWAESSSESSWVELSQAELSWVKLSQAESSLVECSFFSDQTLLRRNRIGLVLDIGIPPIGNFLIHQHVQARRHISGWLFQYRITLSTLEMWPVRRKFSASFLYF